MDNLGPKLVHKEEFLWIFNVLIYIEGVLIIFFNDLTDRQSWLDARDAIVTIKHTNK